MRKVCTKRNGKESWRQAGEKMKYLHFVYLCLTLRGTDCKNGFNSSQTLYPYDLNMILQSFSSRISQPSRSVNVSWPYGFS